MDELFSLTIPITMVAFGVTSNIVIFLVFRRKKFYKKLSRNYFCLMSITDAISLLTILPNNLSGYGINLFILNQYACKVITFLEFFFPAMSSWILVLCNIERMLSVKYKNIILFGQVWFQLTIFGGLFALNFGIYYFYAYYTVLLSDNLNTTLSNSTRNFYCDPTEFNDLPVLPILDMANSVVLPFILMLLCSIAIVHSIYLTGNTMMVKYLTKDISKLRRDIRFSVIIILLNTAFLVFNLPIAVLNFTPYINYDDIVFMIINIIFYMQYILNILVYMVLNAEFRSELLVILRIKEKKTKKKHKFQPALYRSTLV